MIMLYKMISTASKTKNDQHIFKKSVLNIMQKKEGSVLDEIFIVHMNTMLIDNGRCCRMILMNTLKYIFIDTCVNAIIKKY